MPNKRIYENGPSTTLNGSITSIATSLVVHSASGYPSSGDFTIKVDSEIMLVTAVSGTTFTVSRGQEATTAATHADGSTVYMPLTVESLESVVVESHGGTIAGSRRQLNFVDGGGVAWTLTDDAANKKMDVSAVVSAGSVGVAHGGTLTGTRGEVNFINSASVTWSLADDPGGNKVDVTATAAGGGGGSGFEAAFTVPALTDYAWLNQGTATAVDDGQGVFLRAPAVGQNNLRCLVMATGATPWTFTAKLVPFMFDSGNPDCGIIVQSSGTSEIMALRLINGTLDCQFFHSPTSYDTQAFGGITIDKTTPLTWFRVKDDGTNRVWYVSVDGINWTQVQTNGRTFGLTADHVGFFVEGPTSGLDACVKLASAALT